MLRDERSCERAALRSERSSERVLLNAVAASQVRCSDLLSFEDDNVMYMQSADYTYTLCALLYVTPVGMKYVCNGCRYGINVYVTGVGMRFVCNRRRYM